MRATPLSLVSDLTPGRKVGILVAVYAATLAINLDITIVNVALPSIATELGAGTRGLQWVVDGYNLAFTALSWPRAASLIATGDAPPCCSACSGSRPHLWPERLSRVRAR